MSTLEWSESLIHAVCRIFWISSGIHTRYAASWHILHCTKAIASCHFRALSHSHSYQLPLCSLSFSVFAPGAAFFIPVSNVFPHVSHYCLVSPVHLTLCLLLSSPCPQLWHLSLPVQPPFNVSLFPLFFPCCPNTPPSQFGVSSEGTHHVNMRQTSVLMSITTWLNMAECVRWIALWRSFCRDRHRYEFMYRNDDSPRAALLKCKMRIKCSWWMVRKRQ